MQVHNDVLRAIDNYHDVVLVLFDLSVGVRNCISQDTYLQTERQAGNFWHSSKIVLQLPIGVVGRRLALVQRSGMLPMSNGVLLTGLCSALWFVLSIPHLLVTSAENGALHTIYMPMTSNYTWLNFALPVLTRWPSYDGGLYHSWHTQMDGYFLQLNDDKVSSCSSCLHDGLARSL